LVAASNDYHAVLVNGDCTVGLSASGLHLSSNLDMSELVGGCVKVIDCPEDLILLVNASVNEHFVLIVSQRVVKTDCRWSILRFRLRHVHTEHSAKTEIYDFNYA
jgi:hypothetical protein